MHGLYDLCSENKSAATAQLICPFGFSNAKSRMSHDAAQIESANLNLDAMRIEIIL